MLKTEISNIGRISSEEEIDSISHDFKLHFDNTRIFYVVDTFDVIEFCFPTLSTTNENIEDNIASSFLAYNFFFFHQQNKPLILEEYKIELFSLWNEVHKETGIFTNKEKRWKEIERIKHSFKINKENILRKMGLLLSISLGLVSESSVSRYKTVLKERILVEKVDIVDTNDKEILEQLISETSHSKKVIEIFSQFCQESRFNLSGKTTEEKYAYLENAYRDIIVYDRINNINTKIQNSKKLIGKYLFLYLSSTPQKSARIASLFSSGEHHTNVYNIQNYSIHRNISQFYLKELITGSSQTALDVELQLTQCREIIKQSKSREGLITHLSNTLEKEIDAFNNKLNLNKKELENIYLLCKSFTTYKSKIVKSLKDNNDIFDEELKKILNEVFERIDNNENANEKLKLTLDNYKSEFQIQNKIFQFLSSGRRNNKNYELKPLPGKDPIRSYVQLYPALLFIHNIADKRYESLFNFFNLIISPETYKRGLSGTTYLKLKQNDLFHLDSYEKKLYDLFLNLVVPNDYIIGKDVSKSENQIVDSLIKLYEINKRRIVVLERKRDESKDFFDVFFYPHKSFELDVAYFLSWLYRRTQRYDEAIDLLNITLLQNDPKDPRLLHSRALCYISEIYETQFVQKSYFDSKCAKAISDLDMALNTFEEMNKTKYNNLLQHIIIGIKNTKCDLYVKMYEFDDIKNHFAIESEARPIFNSLRNNLNEIGERIDDYPTYVHTEVDLEYCESLIALNSNNLIEAKRKLDFAQKKVNSILPNGILANYQYLDETKKKLIKLDIRINKLNK